MRTGKTIFWEDPKIFHANPQNPSSRVSARKVKSLEKAIESFGFLESMHIIANADYTITDGHGRWQAALNLGLSEIPVVFDETTPSIIFMCEQASRKHNQSELLESVMQGANIDEMPMQFRKNYNKIISFCGYNAPKYMAERSVSAAQIHLIERMIVFIKRHATSVEVTQEFGFKLLEWLVSNNQAAKVRLFIEQNRDVEHLLWAIERNKPLKNI